MNLKIQQTFFNPHSQNVQTTLLKKSEKYTLQWSTHIIHLHTSLFYTPTVFHLLLSHTQKYRWFAKYSQTADIALNARREKTYYIYSGTRL